MTAAPAPILPDRADRSQVSEMAMRPWGAVNDVPVYLVDGQWIRDNIDPDFTDYAQSLHKPYVPEGELWVDQATDPTEVQYMARACLIEAREMATGKTFGQAHDAVDAESQVEREDDPIKLNPLIEGSLPNVGPVKVIVVNGQVVRAIFSADWVYGGHHYVYPWIPEGEIWIEDALESDEKFYILLHEASERRKMSVDGWPYERAHRYATAIEEQARDEPQRLRELLAAQEDQPVTKSLVSKAQIAAYLRKHAPELAELVAKEQPSVGDVHATTALGNQRRRRKVPAMVSNGARINPDPIALSDECPECGEEGGEHADGCPLDKADDTARHLRPIDDDVSHTPFPHDTNALATLRPDQVPRFFGALTDQDGQEDRRVSMNSLVAMQNRVGHTKVKAMQDAGAQYDKPPLVVRMNGRNYLADGHHRATAAWLNGDRAMDCKYCDLSAVDNAVKRALEDPRLDAALRAALDAGGDPDAVSWSGGIDVAKIDEDKQQIFGWASVTHIDGALVVDKQDDAIESEELEKAAYDFVLYSRQQGHMHDRVGVGKCIESCVFTKEKSDAGIRGYDPQTGEQLFGWWIGFHVTDKDVWKQHKAGELPELSIGGKAKRVEM